MGGRRSIWGWGRVATYSPKGKLVFKKKKKKPSPGGVNFLFAMRSRSLCLLKTVVPSRKQCKRLPASSKRNLRNTRQV